MALLLTYEGPLPGGNAESTVRVKNQLRRTFHEQLLEFCKNDRLYFNHWVKPLPAPGVEIVLGGIQFVPLVMKSAFVCDLWIELLRRDMPGAIFSGGDIDGRLKTLLDGLRLPLSSQEVHGFSASGDPAQDRCLCLLADDSLITKVEISTHRLLRPLRPGERPTDVEVRIRAEIRQQNDSMVR